MRYCLRRAFKKHFHKIKKRLAYIIQHYGQVRYEMYFLRRFTIFAVFLVAIIANYLRVLYFPETIHL